MMKARNYIFTAPRVEALETHGVGSTFSAALTAFLARRDLMKDAVGQAKEFVRQSLLQASEVGTHRPLNVSLNKTIS